MSALASTVSSRSTSFRSPPVGPLAVSTRTASTTVSVGRHTLTRSAVRWPMLVWMSPAFEDDAEEVLAAEAEARGPVVLGDRHVDEDVAREHVRVDGPRGEVEAVGDAVLAEAGGRHDLHLPAGLLHRRLDAAHAVRLFRRTAERQVHDAHATCLGATAQGDQRRDDLGIGGRGVLRTVVAGADVGLDDDVGAGPDERLHAAERGDRGGGDVGGAAAAGDGEHRPGPLAAGGGRRAARPGGPPAEGRPRAVSRSPPRPARLRRPPGRRS